MSDAYDMIDRFLRNNLGSDDDYAEYSKALDSLCVAQPAQAGQEQVKCYEVVHGTTHNVVRECELPKGVHNALMRAVASSGKKVERPAQAGQVLTDEEIDAAYEKARADYQRSRFAVRGQQLTAQDSPDWWFARAIEQVVLAKRVPMTDEQVVAAFVRDPIAVSRHDFTQGIRYAEVYHGIVGEKGGA